VHSYKQLPYATVLSTKDSVTIQKYRS